jgi:hypothetical protein
VASNSALVVYTDSNPTDVLRACPVLDKPATRALAERLFPDAHISEIGDELLVDALDPGEDVAYLGCFGGLDLVCNWKIMPDRPSQLDPAVLGATERRNTYLYALHADADWCSYGLWQDGELIRSYSVGQDPGVLEDIGEPLSFEKRDDSHSDLGAAAFKAFFGIDPSEDADNDDVDPEMIPVVGYRVSRPPTSAEEDSAEEERPQVALGDRQ